MLPLLSQTLHYSTSSLHDVVNAVWIVVRRAVPVVLSAVLRIVLLLSFQPLSVMLTQDTCASNVTGVSRATFCDLGGFMLHAGTSLR